jgi:hypothetical protein
MPLRDHFRPPDEDQNSWNELYGMWPALIVQQLFPILPVGFVAAPRVHLGTASETDVSTYPRDEYEIRVYDARHGRRLVAAIEIVSPSNKDHPESRRAFVDKVAALIERDVCVSVVDVVTIGQFNLYADLLERIGGTDPALGADPPGLYAVTVRGRHRVPDRLVFETWFYQMALGQPLPTLPIPLDGDLGVSLDLEMSYEAACRVLHIA